jgi:hypothetical protein
LFYDLALTVLMFEQELDAGWWYAIEVFDDRTSEIDCTRKGRRISHTTVGTPVFQLRMVSNKHGKS